jgi:hypothetical protein
VGSKVVNFVTSDTNNWKITEVGRQVGSTKKKFACPDAIMRYQRNMFGVDKGDQLRARGGGFGNKAHFKKWYKKILLGIYDIFLLNAFIAYCLASDERRRKGDNSLPKLVHHEVLT